MDFGIQTQIANTVFWTCTGEPKVQYRHLELQVWLGDLQFLVLQFVYNWLVQLPSNLVTGDNLQTACWTRWRNPQQQIILFSAGSPTGAQAAGSEMDGMEVARRMLAATEAAVLAAQAASRAAESASNRRSDGDGKQWWKLLPKPPPFDHSTRESEISSWKEWSWLFEQYMASVDSRFFR